MVSLRNKIAAPPPVCEFDLLANPSTRLRELVWTVRRVAVTTPDFTFAVCQRDIEWADLDRSLATIAEETGGNLRMGGSVFLEVDCFEADCDLEDGVVSA